MNSDAIHTIHMTSSAQLCAIARQILDEQVTAAGPLSISKIGKHVGQATVGIYQVQGEASTPDGKKLWSAVVKVLGTPALALKVASTGPMREFDVYRSGAFAEICGGVRAPHCYTVEERNGLRLL